MQHTLDDVVAEVAAVPDGWTATDVSRRAGINRSTLHRISNGAVEPTLSTLRELAIVHGMDMTVELRPLSDPDAATAARLLLDATADPDREDRPGVLAWVDRLRRTVAGVTARGSAHECPADAVATLRVLSAAGRASDLRHRQGAVYLRGRRDVLRLASAGEASGGGWAISGGPTLDLWGRGNAVDDPDTSAVAAPSATVAPATSATSAAPAALSPRATPVGRVSDSPMIPGVLWVTDVQATVAQLADTHRTVEDPARADVVVAEADADQFRDLVEIDGVRVAAPVQQLLDCCALGPAAEAHACEVARGCWS